MRDDPPAWLAAMQRRFGGVIREPLDRATGSLRAAEERYDPDAVADALDGPYGPAAARLAVYNRQYWFRLFTVLQTAFPLTTSLLGAWTFNDHASRFLVAHPPRSWDLDRAPDGFERFLAEDLGDAPGREALLQSARIDAAWRELFRAPAVQPFRPRPEEAATLLDARLVPSPAVALVAEDYPLLELKHAREGHRSERPVDLPPRLAETRWWALRREPRGVRHLPLERREGELLSLVAGASLRSALAELEARCDPAERAALPARVQRWLARSVEQGFWCGVEAGAQRRTQV